MALNFRSDGTNVTYQNLGGAEYWGAADIPTGSIVVDNLLVGVAMSEIVYGLTNETGQGRVSDEAHDFRYSSNSVCRIGEWAYDALLSGNVNAFTKIYWDSTYNVLVKDQTSAEYISDVTAGAPGRTNEGTYGAITVTADTAVATTEWFQLKKNEFDVYYTLWGSFSGTISTTIAAASLTPGGYTVPTKGLVITFASITTPIGGDAWEFFCIAPNSDVTLRRDIGAIVLPYVESKVKSLGQETYNMPLIQPKTAANVIKLGAYVAAKWNTRCRDITPAQGGGHSMIQTGKLFFQFI